MQRKLVAPLLVFSLITLAGCLDDDPAEPDQNTIAMMDGADPFFAGATYNPGTFDPATLSPAIHGMLPVEQVYVTMSDGTQIENGVYRPDTDIPSPIFINFSPYHGDTATTRGDGFGQYLIDNFVPRGYTIILSSIRGTGQSEGCFEVASDRESMDVKEVVDFFADQEWSNGMVAAGGKSYDSTTQNGMIAKFPSDNLRGIFHVSGITDMYRYTFQNGFPARIDSAAFTTTYGVGQGVHEYGAAGAAGGDGSMSDEDPESVARLLGSACPAAAEGVAHPGASTVAGLKTEYWQERDWTEDIASSEWDGSIFFYHGFHDWNVQPSHILPWLENVPEQINVKTWLHQDRENIGHLYPMRADWNLTMLRWLDSELMGKENGFWDEPRANLQGSDGLWRAEDNFPPTRAAMASFAPAGADLDWEVLYADEPMRYSGAPRLTITATTENPDPAITAVLYKVGTDGTLTWINEGAFRGYLSQDLTEPNPIVPGESREYTLEFYPQDDVLATGESWLLRMGGNPREAIVTPAQLEGVTYDLTTAVFELPIIALDQALEPQPTPTECFAC